MGNRGIRGDFKGNSDFGGRIGSQEAYLLSEGGFYPTFVDTSITAVTNSSETSLLIKSAGTQGGNNTSFDDSSNSDHTITRGGNTTTQSFTPNHPGGYSAFFDGTNDFIEGPSVDLLGSGAFTVECWVHILSNGTTYTDAFLAQYQTNNKLIFGVKADVVRVWMAGSEVRVGTININNNGWHHVALVRDAGNSCQLYVDGVADGAAFNNGTDFSTSLENFEIGSWDNGSGSDLHGYIRDLRVVKGTAVYTTAFTPPTEALTAIDGTSLLACHSPVFRDGSTNEHTLTVNGNVKLERFGPYDYEPYSAASHGSSAYLDGTGDYLKYNPGADIAFGTGDFTVEFWVYHTTAPGANAIFDTRGGGTANWGLFRDSTNGGRIQWYTGSSNTYSTGTNKWSAQNTWIHIAYCRSGTTGYFFINGELLNTQTDSTNYSTSSTETTIGARYSQDTLFLQGYLSNIRIVKGTAVYTAAFTPPTSALAKIDGTTLLLNTEPNIYGAADGEWPITLAGNAQTWTAETKNASNSIYFDGTDDAVYVSHQEGLDLPGDFTVEAWIHPLTLSGNRMLFDTYTSGGSGSWQLYWRSIGTSLAWYDTSAGSVISQDTDGSRISTDQWYHVAATRNNDTLELWVDGVRVDADNYSTDLSHSNDLSLGLQKATSTNDFHGYMEDARITKGLSRYPFIPTRTTLTSDDNTSLLVAHTDSVVDGSSNGHTISGNSPTVSNFAPFGTMKSLQFDGVNDQIIAPAAAFDRDADYTIECWYYVETGNYMQFINSRNRKAADGINVSVGTSGTLFFGVGRDNVDAWDLTHTSTKTWNNAWHHFSMTYDASAKRYRIFFDGSQYYTNTVSYHPGSLNAVINIGCGDSMNSGANGYSTGYLSNYRISNFIRYTNSFTPPTTELTA